MGIALPAPASHWLIPFAGSPAATLEAAHFRNTNEPAMTAVDVRQSRHKPRINANQKGSGARMTMASRHRSLATVDLPR